MGKVAHGDMPGAEVFVVGQYPGKDEDKIGQPMQGQGGQWVHWAVAKVAQIHYDKCFFTNILACTPIPKPKVGEVEAKKGPKEAAASKEKVSIRKNFTEQCGVRVREALDLVKPKLIVSMGLVAAKFFSNDPQVKMGAVSGSRGRFCGYPVIYTTHPFEPARQATAQGKKESEAKVIRDFQMVRRMAVELEILDREAE
jgi:uracil-DNA glycosylase